jgi:hypothetical protein
VTIARAYNPDVVRGWLLALTLGASIAGLHPTIAAAQSTDILTEFRAFDGADEVTSDTRFRVTPMDGETFDARRPATPLRPGLYDVQALRPSGGVVAIKRLDRLSVMRYPDEGGRHLEVINFKPGFGALELRAAQGRLEPRDVAIFPAGSRRRPAARPIRGDGYVLFVVPAGQYDVRLEHRRESGGADTHWLLAVTVGADRTRLKLIDAEVEP